jgi:hypothetical protein
MDDLNLRYVPPLGVSVDVRKLSRESFLRKCESVLNPRYHEEVEAKVQSVARLNPETPLTVQTDGHGNLRGVRVGIYTSGNENPRMQIAAEIVSDIIDFDIKLPGGYTPSSLLSYLSSEDHSIGYLTKTRETILKGAREMYDRFLESSKLGTMGVLLEFDSREHPLLRPIELSESLTPAECDFLSHLLFKK